MARKWHFGAACGIVPGRFHVSVRLPRVVGRERPFDQCEPHPEQQGHKIVSRPHGKVDLVLHRLHLAPQELFLDRLVDVILQAGHASGLALTEKSFSEIGEIGHGFFVCWLFVAGRLLVVGASLSA